MSAAALYALVVDYAGLGHHRSGTPGDDATIDWFCTELARRGGDVERRPYVFERYDARWHLLVGGDEVRSLPLFYEGAGRVRTDRPVTDIVDATQMLFAGSVDPALVERARTHGSGAVVLATSGPGGRLVVPNRAPRTPHDVPVVLVEGAAAERLASEPVIVDVEARVVEGRSANVLARFGRGDRPLVLATPLSGWFACAGERGTGVAVVLELAPVLAEVCPVLVVGTTCHELVDLGLERLLEQGLPRRGRSSTSVRALPPRTHRACSPRREWRTRASPPIAERPWTRLSMASHCARVTSRCPRRVDGSASHGNGRGWGPSSSR